MQSEVKGRVFAVEPRGWSGQSWSTEALRALRLPILSTLIGVGVTTLVLLILKVNPLGVYSALLKGALGSEFGFATTLRWATPLVLAGLAVTVALKAGLFNAGLAGQIYVGGFVASWVGFGLALPAGLHPLACVLAGGVAGLAWAVLPALMRRYLGASEIVTSLMLWYVAIGVADFLTRQFFRDPTSAAFLMSVKVLPSAVLTSLVPVGNVSAMLIVAVVGAIGLSIYMSRSRVGYEIRMTGFNPQFAHVSGVSTGRRLVFAFCLSGFIGGMIGAAESLSINQRFVSHFDPGYGFDGFLVAMLANGSLLGCIPAGVFLGILKAGSLEVERTIGVSKSIIWIFQGTTILFVSAKGLLAWSQQLRKISRLTGPKA
jgi:general nucleoside transport system permease protein